MRPRLDAAEALLDLYHQKVISGTEAMRLATNTEAVALGMRGIH